MAVSAKTYAQEYATLWDTMEIVRDASIIEKTASKIIEFRANYEAVEAATNVPWYVVGIMDMREGGGGCCTHLHNGDSLKKQTVNVPAKRPRGNGPFTWQESACDALRMKGFDKIDAWTIETMAFVFERYNGFGYRSKSINIPSPYLWGGTNHQAPGKYVADHTFSKTVVDPQIGCMPLLKTIAAACEIDLVSQYGATMDPSEPSSASNRKAEKKPIATIVKENKELIAVGATVAGGGTAATQKSEPPKPSAKAAIAKGQEVKTIAEQAKDLGTFGAGFAKWATGEGLVICAGLAAVVAVVVAFPKLREKFL